ncbi:MAG: threonine--tRNA ligase [Candidatus Hodarchaeota archaeon]
MKILLIHADSFEFEPKKRAIKAAETVEKAVKKFDDCLVAFSAVEQEDETNIEKIAEKTAKEIKDVAEQLKEKTVVIYPWVHLTENPSRPGTALNVLRETEKILQNLGLTVYRAPFGWYKAFNIACKGHPLSELSRHITPEEVEKETVSSEGLDITDVITKEEDITALKAEEETKSVFYILTPEGALIPAEEFDFTGYENLQKFALYEMAKKRVSETPPPHAYLMRKLELVDYAPGSDAGNLRWLPKGFIVKDLLEDFVAKKSYEYGAMPVETPEMYDYHHPALENYLKRFPARQYVVKSGTKRYFLRFSACFGQFLIKHDATISYKNLPLKMFELTRYAFRREQRGELSALRRLRAFTMPDMHTICKDMNEAKKVFTEQFNLSREIMQAIDVEPELEIAFRVVEDFWEEDKDWIIDMIKQTGKHALIEMFKQRYAYFITKMEFNFVDSQDKAAALATVQIDVENAQRFDITFIDRDGKEKNPLLLHCSISGAIERCLYAMLEKAHMEQEKGNVPELPLWVSPIQVRIIPVSERYTKECMELADTLNMLLIRTDLDDRELTVGKKIREAEINWIPLIIVMGEKEIENNILSVRIRKERKEQKMTLDQLIEFVEKYRENKPKIFLPYPKEVSKQPSWIPMT